MAREMKPTGEIAGAVAPPTVQPTAQMSTITQTGGQTPGMRRTDVAEELMKLGKAKEQGILSDTEFNELKSALINQAKRDAQS